MLQHFEPKICYLPPTYIFNTSKITGTINNDDNKIFKYEWRLYSSKEEEEEIIHKSDLYSPEGRNNFHSLLLFHTDSLSIEPISGEIWSKLQQQFVITFNPQIPDNFKQIAYLYNLDTEERIPYEINANALQPSAEFSVNQINVMHVSLEQTQTYSINLINTGKVPFDFELIKRALPHLEFKFSPSSGHIEVGETIPILITFSATYVGQFNETFQYRIVGYDSSCPSITIFGRVIGPSFKIDRNFLDFGNVSYGFLYSQEFEITNTSDIPFEFSLRMKQEKNFDAREFSINPSTGVIPKHSKQKITVEFIPIFVQNYEVTLLVESTKFAEVLGTIKLIGKCLCPYISIAQEVIDLGEIFINHDYIANVNLVDETDFPAKYEFIEFEDRSSHELNLTYLKYKGSISAHSNSTLPIKVTPKQLGHLEIQRSIRIFGSDFLPISYTITALCIGPKLQFPSNVIDFGHIPVFQDTRKVFPILNDSLIPAVFDFQIKNENQMFQIEPESGEIEPGETLNLNVISNLDDSINYNAKLTMNVKYLNPFTFDIKAKGVGTAIVSSIEMDNIDLGFVFTMQPSVINFSLTNKGRRIQELKWSFLKPKIEGNSKAVLNSKVIPESVNISPGETIDCQFIFECKHQCAFSIIPVCQSTVGKQRYELFKPEIKGIFIKPMLTFGSNSLTFKYIHDVDQEEKLTGNLKSNELIVPSQSLLKPITIRDSITNSSELPLEVEARCEKPFQISQSSFFIQPREVVPFDITFNTNYKMNFASEEINRKIQFVFKDNPHKYIINLKGMMIFPNLSFSKLNINFGNLLKGTEESRIVNVKNESEVPARFYWEIKDKQGFDIYPISDTIDPGETKDVHFTFYAGEVTDFKNTAVCHVIGGPEYPIELSGSSSCTNYTLDHKKIDFGKRDYMETLTDSVLLTNKSTAPINYCIKLPKGLKFQTFSIEPMKGVLQYNKSVTFNFKLVAGLPRSYDGRFLIQIGNFDEVQFDIHVDCYIPQILFNVERFDTPQIEQKIEMKTKSSSSSENGNETKSNSSDESNKMSQLEAILSKSTKPKEREKDEFSDALESERKYMIEQFTAPNKRRRDHQKLEKVINFKGVVLSSFVIDFGELILGDNKTMNCDLKNVTPYPISFDLLANSLSGTGFSINTTSFRNIPPNEVITLIFQFESDKRTHGLGKHDLEIPLIFDSELGYIIHIVGDIKMPLLTFSKTNFVFEPTIVGQKWTQTFQIQNQNPIPVTFTIDECQNINILQKSNPPKSSTFIAYPNGATLPPYSLLNVDITFSPTGEKDYLMQFPVRIKYSDTVNLQVKGEGIMMKLFFDPPEINFDSIQPFSDKAIATVDLVNKSLIDIEVFSQQFDFQLFCNQLTKKFMELRNPSEEELTTTFSSPVTHTILKFSQVIIIHGPPKSGKTTVSSKISAILDIPVINLKEIWSDKQELADEELINIFKEKITDKKYLKGFVIDGLDAFPENSSENEQFIMHFLKQKSTLDELSKNPYTILNDPIITSTERMVNLLTSSLDGQYLFFIGLNANETICHNHESLDENEQKQAKISKIQQEMDDLFNMDEDTYMNLTEEEQMIVDEKREHFRKYKIEHNGDFSDYNPLVEEEKMKIQKGKTKKTKVPRGQVPNDPILQSVILFQYTFGRISEKVRTESSTFKNIFISHENEEEESNLPTEREKEKENPRDKKKKEEVLKSIANSNCLIVNSFDTIDCVMNEIVAFLPSKEKFVQIASYIPQPKKQMPDSSGIQLCPPPELFAIVNDEPPGDFPDILKPAPPASQQKKRKQNASSTIKEPQSILPDPNILDDVDLMNYTPRWKIPPDSRVTLKVSFDSVAAGAYSGDLLFGLANCRNDIYKLPVSGICYYADIDRSPESLYPKIVNNLPKLNKVQNAFITSTNEFYFGALLVCKDRTRNSTLAYKAALNLVNNSEFVVETFCDLKVSGVKTAWHVENPNQSIKPGETGNLIIGFNPTSVDVYRNRLTIMIKDNPEPIYVDLLGEGCSPVCEISTTALDFDKLLLGMSRTLTFSIKNNGKIPAFWKIKGGNVLGNAFTISTMEGVLNEKGSVTVTITFSSEKAYNAKKVLQIDIFDITKSRVFMSHHISVSAESFDVLFDFVYPKTLDHLNFGTVKVGEEKVLQCQLKNKGKYPNRYEIFINKTFNYPNMIRISPSEGEVPPGEKGVFVNVSFKAESSKKFNNCKAIMLKIADPINNQVTSTIPLPFSVETVYSSFLLNPSNILDFGPVPVSTTVTKSIVLKNNGVFPFDFEVFPKIEVVEPKYPTTRNGKGRNKQQLKSKANQKSASANKGKKKGTGKEFQIDHFNVSQSAGNLNPDGDVTFSVSFNSSVDGIFENTIVYKISDSVPKLREGIPLNLKASVFIPGIVTDDFEKIFPKQLLCLRYDIMKKDTAAFIEDDQIYHFSPVVLQQSSKVEIDLINPHPIPCVVDVSLKPRNKGQSASRFPFEMSEKVVNIAANSKSTVSVTFSPGSIDLFRGLFEANVHGGLNPKTKSLKFGIEGQGTLPSVTVIDQEKGAPLLYGKTLINTSKNKVVVIQNNGIVPATLNLTTDSQTPDDFHLENPSKVVHLDVQQSCPITVRYCPLAVQKSQMAMHVEVADNPSSNIDLEFVGEGFHQDVFFEGIKGDENELYFNNVIGQRQQISFMMRNVCKDNVRFQWQNHNEFTFSPRIGHLHKGETKKITVTHYSEKPSKSQGILMKCQWSKIRLTENEEVDWDDSMKVIKFVDRASLNPHMLKPPPGDERPKGTARKFPGAGRRNSSMKRTSTMQSRVSTRNLTVKRIEDQNQTSTSNELIKVVEVKPEPLYKQINGKQKDLQLKVFAVSDFIKYSISTSEIEFPATMMFEKRSVEFTMTNTSQIRFNFSWAAKQFSTTKTNYASSHSCPFLVEPASGSLDAGETATFVANFLPEEVDDFSAHLMCEIPFLTQMEPPDIHVTGRSRRPVCHFYLETSDYLTANRRHPDFTEPLPKDVRVVEIYASKLKKMYTKQFGILNTTDTPYEVTWERIDKKDDDEYCPIICSYPRALVSSGKKHIALFSYRAVSVKTVESLWLFSIPEYNIHITFLFVGKMMPQ